MPQFAYIAKDTEGKTVTGSLEFENVKGLIEALRQQGLVVVNVREDKKGASQTLARFSRGHVSLDELVVFTRMLATMVDSGIPIIQGLEILHEQVDNTHFKNIILLVKTEIEKGSSFSNALSRHNAVFSNLYVSMVRAGESSGTLDEILDRLANYLEKMSNLIKKVKSALAYPLIVTIIAIAVVTFMFMVVIPVFKGIYENFNAPLPAPTRVLLAVSDFLVKNWIWTLFSLLVGIILFVRYIRTERGRLWFDHVKLNMIIFGPLFKKLAITKFSRTLATLARSGVPILQALEIVGATAANKVIENAVLEVRGKIKEGEGLARPLSETKVFPAMVVRMIAVGEESGELEKMLGKISDFYDAQVDAAIAGLTSIIEPLMIAFLGVVIGAIVICMYLPIFSMWRVIAMS